MQLGKPVEILEVEIAPALPQQAPQETPVEVGA